MIEVIKKVGVGNSSRLVEGTLADLKSKNLVWVNAVNPTRNELHEISEKTKIPLEELREYLDRRERPKTFELDGYSLIVFGAPVKEHFIKTCPVSIFVSASKDIITMSHCNIEAIDRIQNLVEDNKLKIFSDESTFVYRLLAEMLADYFTLFEEVEDQIEHLEDSIIRKPVDNAPSEIFRIKKTLIYFHKALTANREVISSIEKEFVTKLNKRQLKIFRELYNDNIQLIDTTETFRDILTGTLDIHLSQVSNNMNLIMKRLTVYATLVMVPTLISGIYGMNFKIIPELKWHYGYPFSIGLMILSVIIIYYYFKRNNWV